jgi:hypothetical protein
MGLPHRSCDDHAGREGCIQEVAVTAPVKMTESVKLGISGLSVPLGTHLWDFTAKTLPLHRSTLRYRPQRIRDMSHYDLNDPDTRFHLQLATRAWKTMHAIRQGWHSCSR